MIALHGWNLKAEEWRATSIAELAERYGILIVCPQMGKANYEKEYFSETRMKWNPMPSGLWVHDVLLPYIREHYRVSTERSKNGLIGVSTGAHGAALLAGYFPKTWGFAASISGDYDVSLTPKDGLAKASFGPHATFAERWKANSLVAYMDVLENTRLYIGHGSLDRIAPVSQSRLWAKELEKRHTDETYPYLYHEVAAAGHDWNYWRTEIAPAFSFFVAGFQ